MNKLFKKTTVLNMLMYIFLIMVISTKLSLGKEAPPNSIISDNRIKTLVYDPNEIYHLTIHFGYQTVIKIADHENIENIFLGESYAWNILENNSYIMLNALVVGVKTNMIIKTNKRLYLFELTSKKPDENLASELIYLARFFYIDKKVEKSLVQKESKKLLKNYSHMEKRNIAAMQSKEKKPLKAPDAATAAPDAATPPATAAAAPPAPDPYIDVSIGDKNINFDYSLTGSEEVSPLRIFDNGKKTFMFLKDPKDINDIEIYVKDPSGKTKKLSPETKSSYIYIEGVYPIISMKIKKQWVNIFNEKSI